MNVEKEISSIEKQDMFRPLEKQQLRLLYLRMVYCCLTPMLLADALCMTAAIYVPSAYYFVLHNLLALSVAVSTYTCLFAVLATSETARRRVPCVYILMVALTVSAGYVLSAIAVKVNLEDLLRAATCTCVVVMIVSFFALFHPCDFTSDASFLWIEGISVVFGVVILICGSVVILGEKSMFVNMGLFSSIMLLFALYLLHDMQLATGTGGFQLPPAEYTAIGAFLWADITNIFLFTLAILTNGGSS